MNKREAARRRPPESRKGLLNKGNQTRGRGSQPSGVSGTAALVFSGDAPHGLRVARWRLADNVLNS